MPEDKQRDVAEALADLGLVRVVPPRSSEDRAARYDALAAAEQRAREKKLRLHSGRAPPPGPRVADLVGDARRARTYLPALQRAATVRATVEAVFSGSRVKLRAPAEGCAFVFGLACVRAPAAAARGRSGDACGDEARAFARRHLLQRVVDARVLDMDRHGVALGTLRLLPEDAKRSRHAPAPPGAPAVAAADDAFESRLLARASPPRTPASPGPAPPPSSAPRPCSSGTPYAGLGISPAPLTRLLPPAAPARARAPAGL